MTLDDLAVLESLATKQVQLQHSASITLMPGQALTIYALARAQLESIERRGEQIILFGDETC